MAEEKEIVLSVKGVYKKFCLSLKRSMVYGLQELLKNLLGIKPNNSFLRKGEFWALQDINIDLHKGESLGIIGLNGSGKSTLLRVLNGIFPPDLGEVKIKGKIGGLIAVGVGFHPHMTGRENIYLNGTILGMTRKEIDNNLESIISFSEIGAFLEAPVSTYSSGMRVRLGFAIAIHYKPDILLIDEVLAVGDLSFVNKSLRFLAEYRKKAKALIYISHNLEQIRILCNRLIILDKGKKMYDGPVAEGLAVYQEMSRERRLEVLKKEEQNLQGAEGDVTGTDSVQFLDSGILNNKGEKTEEVWLDEPFSHYVDFEVREEQENLFFGASISDEHRKVVVLNYSNDNSSAEMFNNVKAGKYRILINYTSPNLNPGVYSIANAIRNGSSMETFQRIVFSGNFRVRSEVQLERAVVHAKYNWELIQY